MRCMKMLKLLAVACLLYTASGNEEPERREALNSKYRDMRLFAYYSTSKFVTSLTTSTSVRFFTCLSIDAAPDACAGRRRRRKRDFYPKLSDINNEETWVICFLKFRYQEFKQIIITNEINYQIISDQFIYKLTEIIVFNYLSGISNII